MTSLDELIADSWFPFAGDITVKPLEDPVVPEPQRHGEDSATCGACARADDSYVWTDTNWRLTAENPSQLRGVVLLETREHFDTIAELPRNLLAELGPVMSRVEQACLDIGDVGRVHVNRWGDGSAHFHLWFIPRPLGALQLRGSMLPMWLDLMPDLDDSVRAEAQRQIGASMAAQGGTAQPGRSTS
jgi:diadenosine tetraphosphate (Ap4A) HIT family hydrolase